MVSALHRTCFFIVARGRVFSAPEAWPRGGTSCASAVPALRMRLGWTRGGKMRLGVLLTLLLCESPPLPTWLKLHENCSSRNQHISSVSSRLES